MSRKFLFLGMWS